MKKILNTESITNELEGASLFFTKPASSPPQTEPMKTPIENRVANTPDAPSRVKEISPLDQVQTNEDQDQKRSFERSTERTVERTIVRPSKQERIKVRHTFDVYKDQLLALQEIQIEKVRAGRKKPKLGKMVSDGIDLYLKLWTSKKKQG